jgi:predicted  nucleic acid-binding Zn-ribbon protein
MSDLQSVHVSGGAVDGKLSWSMMDGASAVQSQLDKTDSAIETLKSQMSGFEHRMAELVQQQQQQQQQQQIRSEFEHRIMDSVQQQSQQHQQHQQKYLELEQCMLEQARQSNDFQSLAESQFQNLEQQQQQQQDQLVDFQRNMMMMFQRLSEQIDELQKKQAQPAALSATQPRKSQVASQLISELQRNVIFEEAVVQPAVQSDTAEAKNADGAE